MKTLDQLRKEFESHGIPPYLTIDETAMLFFEIDRLEKENTELKSRLYAFEA